MSNRQSPQCAVTPHALNLFFIFYALHYSSNIRTSHHLHTHTQTQTLSPEASHFLFPHSWWKNRKIYLLTVCSKCSNIPKKATQLFFPDSSYYIKYKATCSWVPCSAPYSTSTKLQKICPHQQHDLLAEFQRRDTGSFLSTPAELKSKAIKLFPPSLHPGLYQLELIPLCATWKFEKLEWEVCFYWNQNKNKTKLAAFSWWLRDPGHICLLPFLYYNTLSP